MSYQPQTSELGTRPVRYSRRAEGSTSAALSRDDDALCQHPGCDQWACGEVVSVMAAHPIVDSVRYRRGFVELACMCCTNLFAFTRLVHGPDDVFVCHNCRLAYPGVASRIDAGREARPVATAPCFPKLPAKMRFVRRSP